MKKDLWVKLAGLAIVLTLISATLVSGTYAKYVKAVTGTDTARVAKFAFNLKDGTNTITQSETETADFDIFSYTDTGVYGNGVNGTFIAPGTTGNFGLTVENLSEVDVVATLAIVETNANGIPLYYTIGEGTQRYSAVLTGDYSGGTYQNITALSSAIQDSIGALEATAGTTPTTKDVTLNWTWAFETAGTGQADTSDTALGIAGAATVILSVAVTVAQTD